MIEKVAFFKKLWRWRLIVDNYFPIMFSSNSSDFSGQSTSLAGAQEAIAKSFVTLEEGAIWKD